jgi:predicted MFS family arabinose efflux permease
MHILFGLLIVSIAMVTGSQFHIASVLQAGDINKVAATNYSADLVGSAAGAILVNAWIIPSFGFIASLLVIAGVSLCGIILMLIKKQVKI